VNSRGIDLPIRLQLQHSHWYCRTLKCITLRPRIFNQRAVQFLLIDTGPTGAWDWYQVPDHLKDTAVSDLLSKPQLSKFNRMVLGPNDSAVLDIMCQFEYRSLIHLFLSSPDSLIFEFPRFDLSFELRDGKLYSRAYLGY